MKTIINLLLCAFLFLVMSCPVIAGTPDEAPQTVPEVLEHLRNIRLSNDNVERVKNGTFTGAATDWTLASGWAYSANTVVKNGAGTGALEQNVNAQSYEIWLVTATISNWTAGTTLTPSIGGVNGTAITGNSSYSEYILTTAAGNLKFTPTTDVRCTIDSVSAKRADLAVFRNAAGSVVGWIRGDGAWSFNNGQRFETAEAVLDEGTITLPRVTANWTGHGFVRFSASGGTVVTDSAEFETGSDGNPYAIRGSADVVYGAACANAKICISTAGAQNPIIIQFRNGAGNAQIEFDYR